MRVYLIAIFILLTVHNTFSFEIGAALSIDYYNNPIVDSAPSPIQQRPIIFQNLTIGSFNLKTGIGLTEGYYEISDNDTPVFNDNYSGFYTVEFDIFAYPGFQLNFDNVAFGVSAGGGVRLPVLAKEDSGMVDSEVQNALDWFYQDSRFIFWGVQLYTAIKLPLSVTGTKFFGEIHYTDFIYRDDQWIIGATAGLLWHFD